MVQVLWICLDLFDVQEFLMLFQFPFPSDIVSVYINYPRMCDIYTSYYISLSYGNETTIV